MPRPEPGDTLAERYLLRDALGDGGTATVFRADDLELGREVAIKVYAAETPLSDADRRRREARALAGLRHPSIVTLHDARLDADPPFLVLEFVDGETLADRLTRGPLGVAESREIARSVASGLAAAHAAGIVHRDVKPANILLPHGPGAPPARLLDFGIAHSLGAERATTLGTVVGSAVYLSPEQARGGEVTAASDVYSLGLVLIEAVTGRPAFTGTTEEVLSARLFRQPALDDDALADDAPLLRRMTALDPADRPGIAEVEDVLGRPAATRLLPATTADRPTEAFEPAGAPVAAPRATRPPRAFPARGAVAAAAVIGVLGLLVAVGVVTTAAVEAMGRFPAPAPAASEPAFPTSTPTPTPPDEGPGNGNPGKGNGKDKKP